MNRLATPALLAITMLAPGCAADPVGATTARPVAPMPTATDARGLLHEAVGIISTRSIGRRHADWTRIEAELAADLPAGAAPSAAHGAIARALGHLGDAHARFVPPPSAPAPAASGAGAQPPADRPGAPVRRIPDTPEGNLLDGRVAYLLIPGCPNGDADQLRRWARALNDRVHTLGRQNPVGWIIDLRLNGGGNVWPMLLGLRGILLDGVCMTSLESASVTSRFGVSATHGAWIDWGSGPQTQLDWAADPPAESTVPGRGTVAVLLGPWTMSSGEALAIALRSAGARTFGEPTAGLTTVTNMFPLSDGSTLILPVSRMGDAGGRPVHGRLTPDQLERFGDWPTPDDEAARAAAAWVTSRAGRPVVAD